MRRSQRDGPCTLHTPSAHQERARAASPPAIALAAATAPPPWQASRANGHQDAGTTSPAPSKEHQAGCVERNHATRAVAQGGRPHRLPAHGSNCIPSELHSQPLVSSDQQSDPRPRSPPHPPSAPLDGLPSRLEQRKHQESDLQAEALTAEQPPGPIDPARSNAPVQNQAKDANLPQAPAPASHLGNHRSAAWAPPPQPIQTPPPQGWSTSDSHVDPRAALDCRRSPHARPGQDQTSSRGSQQTKREGNGTTPVVGRVVLAETASRRPPWRVGPSGAPHSPQERAWRAGGAWPAPPWCPLRQLRGCAAYAALDRGRDATANAAGAAVYGLELCRDGPTNHRAIAASECIHRPVRWPGRDPLETGNFGEWPALRRRRHRHPQQRPPAPPRPNDAPVNQFWRR